MSTRNALDLHPCLEDCSHVPGHRLAQHLPVGHLGDRTLLPRTLEDQLLHAWIHFLDDRWWCDLGLLMLEKIYENLMGYCMNVHMRILYVIAYYIHAIQDVLMGNMLMFYHSPRALQFLGDVCDATSTRELAGNWLGLPEQRHCSGRSFVATLAALEGTMPSGYLQDRHHVDQQSGRNASSGKLQLMPPGRLRSCHWSMEP